MASENYLLTSANAPSADLGTVLFETKRLVVRRYLESDAEALAKAADFASISTHIRDGFPSPYTVEDAQQFILRACPANTASYPSGVGIFIKSGYPGNNEQGPLLVGGMGIIATSNVHYRSWELGYWFTPTVARQGYGLEVVKGFVPWAFSIWPDLTRIECHPFSSNVASVGLLSKAGFQLEGTKRRSVVKNGVILDELIFGIIREDLNLL